MYLNEVRIAGNLGRDPEIKTTQGGLSVGAFSVCVNQKNKDGTKTSTWFNCKVFGEWCKTLANYKSGDNVYVAGRLSENKWTDKTTGQERKAFEVVANSIARMQPDPFSDAAATRAQHPAAAAGATPAAREFNEFAGVEIPF